MKKSMTILNNQVDFLHFLKSKFPVFHLSNVFFRDLHYGVIAYLGVRKVSVKYGEAEQIAREIAAHFERQNVLKKVNQQGWVVHYPEFAAKKAP